MADLSPEVFHSPINGSVSATGEKVDEILNSLIRTVKKATDREVNVTFVRLTPSTMNGFDVAVWFVEMDFELLNTKPSEDEIPELFAEKSE